MHPELYLIVYRQQEREREVLLHRRLAAAERARTTPAASRRAGMRRPRRFGVAWFARRRAARTDFNPAEPCATA